MATTAENTVPGNTAAYEDAMQRAEIDRSVRLPVLFFITSGLSWLLMSAVIGFIASMKMHNPLFLGEAAWLSYGRTQPAHLNAFIYGWVFQSGLGVGLWVMARLGRTPLRSVGPILIAGHAWNFGVTLGVLCILFGAGTSIEWLDFPAFVWPVLFISYSIIAGYLVVMFQTRRDGHVYISQWFLLGAVFWFPWIYLTANMIIHVLPGAGVISAAVNSWYVSALLILWVLPVGLGASYYLVPKIVGRPIFSYQMALGGFWMLAILGGWTGMQAFMGGPLPAWMPAVSGMAMILLLIPATAVAINHHRTVKGSHALVQYSPTLRFTAFGAFSLNFFILAGALQSFFGVAKVTQFTHVDAGYQMLGLYAFFTMIMFGAIYFIVPRLVKCEWRSGGWIRFHFWFSAYGIIAMVTVLFLAGLEQGRNILSYQLSFRDSVEVSAAYLVGRSLAWAMITLSNLVFLFHILIMVLRLGRRSPHPTLLHEMEEETSLNVEGAKA